MAWIMPFFIIWCPALILESQNLWHAGIVLMAIIMMSIILQAANLGYFRIKTTLPERVIALISGLLFIVYCFNSMLLFFAVAFALAILFFISQRLRERKLQT